MKQKNSILGNRITPYKNRGINFDKPVSIYRCLNKKGVCYSIKQNGLVKAHTDCLMLGNVKFKVSEKGRLLVRRTKQKNVHAFAVGYIAKNGGMGTTAEDCEQSGKNLPAKITYNPYVNDSFVCTNLTKKPFKVNGASVVVFNSKGVFASYLN